MRTCHTERGRVKFTLCLAASASAGPRPVSMSIEMANRDRGGRPCITRQIRPVRRALPCGARIRCSARHASPPAPDLTRYDTPRRPRPPVIFTRHDQLDLDAYTPDRIRPRAGRPRPRAARRGRPRGGPRCSPTSSSGEPAYGINTGLGLLATRAVSTDDQAAFQRTILVGRAGASAPRCPSRSSAGRCCCGWPGSSAGCRASAPVSAGSSPTASTTAGSRSSPPPSAAPPARRSRSPTCSRRSSARARCWPTAGPSPAAEALHARGIEPLELGAKEGIALINGAPRGPGAGDPAGAASGGPGRARHARRNARGGDHRRLGSAVLGPGRRAQGRPRAAARPPPA